jgi:ElaB/YqjD/DUF883 family membrane-anchored ribosome-binding protein
MDEKLAVDAAELQAAMALKRSSLRENISHLEKEVEQKVLETVEQMQHKVLAATDELTRKLTRPMHVMQEKIDAIPKSLRSKPAKTLLTVAAVGLSLGYMLGRRGRHRYYMTRALSATMAPRVLENSQQGLATKANLTRGIFATLAMEAAHQILSNSLSTFMRRRN